MTQYFVNLATFLKLGNLLSRFHIKDVYVLIKERDSF